MKLTTKIIIVYMLATALLVAWYGHRVAERQDEQLQQEIAEQAHSIGLAIERQLVVIWQRSGHDGVGRMLGQADRQIREMSIRWIALTDRTPGSDLAATVQQLKLADRGRVLTIRSRGHLRMYFPIDVSNQRAGCVEFSQPLKDIDRQRWAMFYQTSTLIFGMLACGGLVTLVGYRLVGQRLEQLIQKTKRIGQGDFVEPLHLRGRDELSQLATALNEMSQQLADQQHQLQTESIARLAAVEQLRHVDRLNTVGRLASGVAHELGTPLNVVSGRAHLIASGRLNEADIRDSALVIKSESDRMAGIIRQLMDFARRRSPQRKSTDLRHLADRCAELLSSLATKQQVRLEVTGDASLDANVDAAQIQQVLTNLIVNAIQAMPQGGTVLIDVQPRSATPPNGESAGDEIYCCISVSDEGSGIAPDDREHLFEPFFTTKDVGEGTGLGLSVSYGIVQDHGGWIDVRSEPGSGSCFRVYLPCT